MAELHGTRITWLGHATFQITTPLGKVILIDPWLTGNPAAPVDHKIEDVDILLVTHGHGDHTTDVVEIAKKHNPTVIGIVELVKGWLAPQGVEKLIDLNIGGSFTVEGITVTMTRAIHTSSVVVDGRLTYAGEPAGYIIHIPEGLTLYFAGDTDVFGDMSLIRDLHAPDIAFLPIGDYYTMGPRSAAYAARLLGVKQVIPMHYGTFPILIGTPQALRNELKEIGLNDVQVLEIKPGETIG